MAKKVEVSVLEQAKAKEVEVKKTKAHLQIVTREMIDLYRQQITKNISEKKYGEAAQIAADPEKLGDTREANKLWEMQADYQESLGHYGEAADALRETNETRYRVRIQNLLERQRAQIEGTTRNESPSVLEKQAYTSKKI